MGVSFQLINLGKMLVNLFGSHLSGAVFTNSVYTDQKILPQTNVELQPTVEQRVTETC